MTRTLSLHAALSVALMAAAPLAFAQGSASPVIGYYKFQAPPGASLWTCALTTKKEFQGQATSVTAGVASTIFQSNAAWTAGAFNLHYVEIVEGPWAGLVLDILQNTATSVQVDGNLGAAGFNLGQNVKYLIRKHATLGAIFKNGAGLTAFVDTITLLYDNNTSRRFYYSDDPPGQIVASNLTTNRDNEIVYPGQGMLLTCSGPRTLIFGGGEVSYVKDTPTKIPLYAGAVNYVGQMNPIVALNPLGAVAANEKTSLSSPALGLVDSNLAEYLDLVTIYGRTNGVFSRLGAFYYDAFADTMVTTAGAPTAATIPHGFSLAIKPSGNRYFTQPAIIIGN